MGAKAKPEINYQYLERRPAKATKHLCIKGRNMTVFNLVAHMRANSMTPEEVAQDAHLPVEAVHEAMEYFEANQESILAENDEVVLEMQTYVEKHPELHGRK